MKEKNRSAPDVRDQGRHVIRWCRNWALISIASAVISAIIFFARMLTI